jgi:hypothetical protein
MQGGVMFFKEIIYLTYYQAEEKKGNAGYAKVEIRNGEGTLCLTAKGIPDIWSGVYPVSVYDGEKRIQEGKITIRSGCAGENFKIPGVQSIDRVEIMLGNSCRVEGTSKNYICQEKRENQRKEHAQEAPEKKTKEKQVQVVEKKATEKQEPTLERKEPEKQIQTYEAQAPERQTQQEVREDKWEQIMNTYEVLHPYGDDRAYIKLEPKDFVIMQAKYQNLVNNSFLLHGFYNYRYLILGKEKETEYYLGVPGVFYEREKMVALMFGFEAFECEGGIARPGGFGYYLRKVEL